jgi:hypothetical protein
MSESPFRNAPDHSVTLSPCEIETGLSDVVQECSLAHIAALGLEARLDAHDEDTFGALSDLLKLMEGQLALLHSQVADMMRETGNVSPIDGRARAG